MKRGMPSGAQTPDGIIFLLALIFSKAPPRYPPHHGAHWAYTTIQEYCELKDLPYENVRRWIGILKKEREGKSPASGELEFVEVPLAAGGARNGSDSGISLHAAGFEIQVTCDFDQATLLNVLTVLRTLACSVSAEQ